MSKLTVQEYHRKSSNRKTPYDGDLLSWVMFNRKAENIWARGGWLKFIGEDLTEDGKLFCAFKDDKTHIYRVENDVVFNYQKDKKPVTKFI